MPPIEPTPPRPAGIGMSVTQQQVIPVVYEGTRFEMGFRADLVVQDSVMVEIKPPSTPRKSNRKRRGSASLVAATGRARFIGVYLRPETTGADGHSAA